MRMGVFSVLCGILLYVALASGCAYFRDAVTGEESKGFDPCFVARVDAGVEVGTEVIETAKPFIPPPYRWLLEIAGLAVLVWQRAKTIRIVKGSKAAKTALDRVKKSGATIWKEITPGLHSAEDAGAIMPDKL